MKFKNYSKINEDNATIVGLQFGDEGKGKIVDLFAENFDIIVRFQGGDNAGHTVVINDKIYKLSLIPSGIFHKKQCVLGSGVVINPYQLQKEINSLEEQGVEVKKNLFIADNAMVIFSLHKKFDALSEAIKRECAIGTTGKGIGACYSQKLDRVGLRVCDLFENNEYIKAHLEKMMSIYNCLVSTHDLRSITIDELLKEVDDFREILKPYIIFSYKFFQDAIDQKKKILFEGAQGLGLDISHGSYPFVTSSSTYAAQVALGAPVAINQVGKIYGILKAYATRVGNGPFPTEDFTDEVGKTMQSIGQEFGTITGRERRCGWLDLVITKQFILANGISSIVLTKIDVLDCFEKIKICIGYEINGKQCDYFPSAHKEQDSIKPIYIELDGWKNQGITENIRSWSNLPQNAKLYIEYIEEFLQTKIEMISTGPDRYDTFFKEQNLI